MASFNFSTRQMSAKIVYYGPGLCGKTTSLKYVFHHTRADARGKMVSLATETDRTLFFDLLPLEVGTVAGFHTRIQLYTVPGQVFYNSTRRLVLKGVDGIVFVADSQPAMLPSNVESFRNMEVNLEELGIKTDEIPLVLQYNKRDLPEVCSVAELSEALNSGNWPEFETSAISGQGIFEVLREISRMTLVSLKKQLEDGAAETLTPPVAPAAPGPSPPVFEPPLEAAERGLSDDEIEDRALDQLATAPADSRLVDAVPEEALETTPEPEDGDAEPDREAAAESVDDAMLEAVDAEPLETAEPQETGEQQEAVEPQEAVELLETVEPVEAAEDEEPIAATDQTVDPDLAPERAELEIRSEQEEIEALAARNGRRHIDHLLNVSLPGEDLQRARRVSVDLQVRDERNRVLHQVRDIEWSLQDLESLHDVLLHLKIELEREDG